MKVASQGERLRKVSRTIAEIAAETGFADQSPPTRSMTAVLGISPAAYRRRQQAGGRSE